VQCELNPPWAALSSIESTYTPQWAAWDEGNRIGKAGQFDPIDEPEEEGGLNKLHLTQ
jgi:hypothetical protein